jgi:hypothetical protein
VPLHHTASAATAFDNGPRAMLLAVLLLRRCEEWLSRSNDWIWKRSDILPFASVAELRYCPCRSLRCQK